MLTEGLLAVIVIVAVAAGIGLGYQADGELQTGITAWNSNYSSWAAASGMSSKINAFVEGSANMIAHTGIPKTIALVIMGVFVASFAGTSLDTSARLQRFFLQELFGNSPKSPFRNKYFSTSVVILSAAALAFITGADGKGALTLWPLFGIINQVLAALALIVVTIYLRRKGGRKWVIAGIPAIFMGIVSLWAAVLNQISWNQEHNLLLVVVNGIIILLSIGVIIEGIRFFFKRNQQPGLN